MAYLDYTKMTAIQQAAAREICPKFEADEFARLRFWVRKDGKLSRRNGHHDLTVTEHARINRILKIMTRGDDVRSKGDLRDFKSADFSIVHE